MGTLARQSHLQLPSLLVAAMLASTAGGTRAAAAEAVAPPVANAVEGAPTAGSLAVPDCGLESGVLTHGSRRGSSIALTFDACPTRRHPGFSTEIVDLLERERIPATFFVSGRWGEEHRRELARLQSVPFFEIALHGERHRRLQHASSAEIRAEIVDGRDALDRLGVAPQPLFRPPYGDRPPGLATIAREAGITAVTWDVAPGDPVPTETAVRIDRDVVRAVKGGSIVVLHVNGGGAHTAEALPALVADLRRRSFRFVTVGELLRECSASGDARVGATEASPQ